MVLGKKAAAGKKGWIVGGGIRTLVYLRADRRKNSRQRGMTKKEGEGSPASMEEGSNTRQLVTLEEIAE